LTAFLDPFWMTCLDTTFHTDMPGNWQTACDLSDFDADDDMKECLVGDQEVLLVRVGDKLVSCPALCPHMDEPLAFGVVDGKVLTCTKHAWQWDLETGQAIGLAECALPVAAARIEGGQVLVNLAALCNAKR